MSPPPPSTASSLLILAFLLSPISAAQLSQNLTSTSNLHLPTPHQSLCESLIRPAGYLCSEHKIETRDGYFLGLQRVWAPDPELRAKPGPPVLLQHGLFMAGDAWFLNSPEQSLGFILADEGFDVWVGNVRGTRWSQGHISLSVEDKEYWDWSWQELALCDLSEMINHIYSLTNSKVFIVGHSQGTIMSLAAFTQPDIAEMVEAAALLCPISYLDHISTQFVHRMVDVHLDQMILAMGVHQLNFRSEWGINLLNSICDGQFDCNDLLTSITGKNCCFNNSRVDFYLDYEPHPSSAKNFHHLFQSMLYTVHLGRNAIDFSSGQLNTNCLDILFYTDYCTFGLAVIRKGTFSKYDHGVIKNLVEYGQLKPPAFDLSLIPKSLPLLMAYGGNDALADMADFQHTLKELQSTPQLVYLENYGHVDFIVSTTAKEDLHDKLIEFFRSWGKSSSC